MVSCNLVCSIKAHVLLWCLKDSYGLIMLRSLLFSWFFKMYLLFSYGLYVFLWYIIVSYVLLLLEIHYGLFVV